MKTADARGNWSEAALGDVSILSFVVMIAIKMVASIYCARETRNDNGYASISMLNGSTETFEMHMPPWLQRLNVALFQYSPLVMDWVIDPPPSMLILLFVKSTEATSIEAHPSCRV